MDATFTLASRDRGERTLTCAEFFRGVRKTALQSDEMLVRIDVPALKSTERGTFLKLGLRQAQAISVVNVAAIVDFADDHAAARSSLWDAARSTFHVPASPSAPSPRPSCAWGSRGLSRRQRVDRRGHRPRSRADRGRRPPHLRCPRGRRLPPRHGARADRAGLRQLRDGTEQAIGRSSRCCCRGQETGNRGQGTGVRRSGVSFTLNGKPTTLQNVHGKTLLRALREDAGLTGTKEGCAEGECGACTVWLDGVAVMSCLVPAERAEGCEVITVEGLARPDGSLSPLQQAFIDTAAVQCGYCTPGILMSAANLLEEFPQPTADQVKQALTGNLCRCTGYYKILEAVEAAAQA